MNIPYPHHKSWKPQPNMIYLVLLVLLSMLIVAVISFSLGMSYEGMPFYYPGVFLGAVIIWLLAGIIHWIRKISGFRSQVYKMRLEHCVRAAEQVLSDFGFKFERIEREKVNFIFLWTFHFDVILLVREEDLSVSFMFNKLSQDTTIFIGKVQPKNKEIVQKIENGIDKGVRAFIPVNNPSLQIP
jgi:hypothetical protein